MKVVLDHGCGRRLSQVIVAVVLVVLQSQVWLGMMILPHGHGSLLWEIVRAKRMLQYAIGKSRQVSPAWHGGTHRPRRTGKSVSVQEIGKHVI